MVPSRPRPPGLDVHDSDARHDIDAKRGIKETALLVAQFQEFAGHCHHQGAPEGDQNHEFDGPELDARIEEVHALKHVEFDLYAPEVIDRDAGDTPVGANEVGVDDASGRISFADVHAKPPFAPGEEDGVDGPGNADDDEGEWVCQQKTFESLDDLHSDLLPQLWGHHLANHACEAVQCPCLIHVGESEVCIEDLMHDLLLLSVVPVRLF
mmetsp:Transcript_65294/g.142215  ORF Transcript_65294/g.142215 Transcript_65294/m.142215 type:complete len:210 (+) Transcript_65294:413-1042(+)